MEAKNFVVVLTVIRLDEKKVDDLITSVFTSYREAEEEVKKMITNVMISDDLEVEYIIENYVLDSLKTIGIEDLQEDDLETDLDLVFDKISSDDLVALYELITTDTYVEISQHDIG